MSERLLDGVSVVVPAFRSAASLPRLADRLAEVLGPAAIPYELVLVDDGSEDGTWEAIERLAAEREEVRGLRLARNYGQQSALLAGIRSARRAQIVTLDDDLQYRPESIPALLDALAAGADLVYGMAEERRHRRGREWTTSLAKRLMRVATGDPMVTRISALRAFRTQLREGFTTFDGPYVSIDALLLWSTRRIAEITVPHDPREEGRSGYSPRSLARHALTVVVGFSSRPLRAASALGFLCTVLGALLLAYVLLRYALSGSHVPGFAFLASTITIFSGVQLFALGVIGEYLARMYPRVMGHPAYAVAAEVGERDEASATAGDEQ
ncbi:MAG TPA: glycosyltransferase [Solirubrobacterales bacterium]|nr:glycosyltransferase [Solirubrobacterales bacterium]